MDSVWRGVIIGVVLSLVSVFGLVTYILFVVGGVVSTTFLILIAALTFVKLVWGVIFGYLVGSFFKH